MENEGPMVEMNGEVYRVGSPAGMAAVLGGPAEIFGRISAIDGGLVRLTTPGGSVFDFGLFYLREPDLEALRKYEAMEKQPYKGNPVLIAATRSEGVL